MKYTPSDGVSTLGFVSLWDQGFNSQSGIYANSSVFRRLHYCVVFIQLVDDVSYWTIDSSMCTLVLNPDVFAWRNQGGLYKKTYSPDKCRYLIQPFLDICPLLSLALFESQLCPIHFQPTHAHTISSITSTYYCTAHTGTLNHLIYHHTAPHHHHPLPSLTASTCQLMTNSARAPKAKEISARRKS